MEAGHFSQTGIFDHARDEAFHYAFLLWALAACPDRLGGGEPEALLVFHIITAIIGMGAILTIAGPPAFPPASSGFQPPQLVPVCWSARRTEGTSGRF